jgi:hypothetical protein
VFQGAGADTAPVHVRLSEETADGAQMPMLNVFHRDGEAIRHFWGSELPYASSEPGQDSRHGDTIDALRNLFDLTPERRGTDWYPTSATPKAQTVACGSEISRGSWLLPERPATAPRRPATNLGHSADGFTDTWRKRRELRTCAGQQPFGHRVDMIMILASVLALVL